MQTSSLPCTLSTRSNPSVKNGKKTSNNQGLESPGDNDQRSKRFCSSAVLCVSFTSQMVKTRMFILRVIEGPSTHDQTAFSAFHTFLVEVQTNAGYIHATHA